jgi:hypothetical protein
MDTDYQKNTLHTTSFKTPIMKNKSLKALALLAIFSVSIAGAAVQFQPQETKETKTTKIEKLLLAKFKPPVTG